MIQISVLGASGRMGNWVCKLVSSEFASTAALAAQASKHEPLSPLLKADVVIDFSSPQAVIELAKLALAHEGPLPAFVVGSTGGEVFDGKHFNKTLESLGAKTPVLISSNFSTGVFVVNEILRRFSPLLEKAGYTPVITETHHRHKKDAPSGTAISLQRAIDSEKPGRIQTHSIRAGEVIGDHEARFFGQADQVTITHHAQDRSIFARGAIEVALWLATKRNGHGALRGILDMSSYFGEIGGDLK